ncbi:MAG: hypothetical protein L0H93_02480 [Nocardioides sp.]|nr:hypothetical protein [Nocardioides sp.]
MRLLGAAPTPKVDEHLGSITQPGHGWAQGVMILSRRDVTLSGVHLVQVKVEDRCTVETETLYFTESGFEVRRAHGTYGDPTRWSVAAYTDTARSALHGIKFTENLAQAAEVNRKKGTPLSKSQ